MACELVHLDRTLHPQRARKRPSALREFQAVRPGMEVRTAPRQHAFRVDTEHEPPADRRSGVDDNPNQVFRHRPHPTPDARPDRRSRRRTVGMRKRTTHLGPV